LCLDRKIRENGELERKIWEIRMSLEDREEEKEAKSLKT
jgi:hypothetical protein